MANNTINLQSEIDKFEKEVQEYISCLRGGLIGYENENKHIGVNIINQQTQKIKNKINYLTKLSESDNQYSFKINQVIMSARLYISKYELLVHKGVYLEGDLIRLAGINGL